eukprot:scaffold139887_cov17-Tisochrysis_lutea.AAC.1
MPGGACGMQRVFTYDRGPCLTSLPHQGCWSYIVLQGEDVIERERMRGKGVGNEESSGRHQSYIQTSALLSTSTHTRFRTVESCDRIALEDPLQVTLAHNYYGMKHLLQTVSSLPGLAGIVH